VAAARFARVTLELGGKSATILLDDVVLPQAVRALAPFTMPFSGQICLIAGFRSNLRAILVSGQCT
jgi:acyl-CoA reductase-like NAD-dependent aldehyde dehydrogenase